MRSYETAGFSVDVRIVLCVVDSDRWQVSPSRLCPAVLASAMEIVLVRSVQREGQMHGHRGMRAHTSMPLRL